MQTCTRRLEFDAAHRVMRHESKCANLHGHRYAVEITCRAHLDAVGRVIDFGEVKRIVGSWIDEALDHGTIANENDEALIAACRENGWKLFVMLGEPTAENLARLIFAQASQMLSSIEVVGVRLYETPNGWADFP